MAPTTYIYILYTCFIIILPFSIHGKVFKIFWLGVIFPLKFDKQIYPGLKYLKFKKRFFIGC